TRTVGWFTTIYPVELEVEAGAGVGEALKAVKEQMRGVRGRGLGWGLLRWLGEAEEISGLEAEISFNYLGQFDQLFSESSPFGLARESTGAERSLRSKRRYLVDIGGSVFEGRLHLSWTYNENVHRRETIEQLAHGYVDALRDLIEHCRSPQIDDLPDSLRHLRGEIEAAYPLSPLQLGLFFLKRYAPNSAEYFNQFSFRLDGLLDTEAF